MNCHTFTIKNINHRVRSMKPSLYAILLISLLIGCAKSSGVQFCEGVSPAGDGVNCGHKFEDGEVTVLITSPDVFGVKTIFLQIYDVKNGQERKIDTTPVEVKPDAKTATANLSLYTGGNYVVRVTNNNALIGENRLEIVEK
jgi:hypothetical protein